MNWILLAIASALFYGSYNLFIKLASSHMHQVLAAVILQATALVVGIVLLILLKVRGDTITLDPPGARLAMIAGVSVALGEVLAFYVFSKGVAVSQGAPVIIGGTVAATGIYGVYLLRESLAPLQWIGFILILAGIVFLTSFQRAG